MRKPTVVTFALLAAFLSRGGSVLTAQGKPKPATPTTCTVSFEPAVGDLLVGDGAGGFGTYADLSDNVTCSFNTTQGSVHYGDLNLSLTNAVPRKGTARYFRYGANIGSPGAPYSAFLDKGVLVFRQLAQISDGAVLEPLAFVAYAYNGQFKQGGVRFRATADESQTQYPKPTDTPLVTRNGCTFSISFEGSVDAWEGSGWSTFRGVYPLPFHLTVTAKGRLQDGTECQ